MSWFVQTTVFIIQVKIMDTDKWRSELIEVRCYIVQNFEVKKIQENLKHQIIDISYFLLKEQR